MKKLKSNNSHKLIVVAVVLLLAISIGYAVLSTTLSINGTANIASNSWLVYFTNVQVKDGSVTATQAPTTSGTATTLLSWAVNMQTPGDFYEYNVDVKNDGTIDAMIGSLSNTSLTTDQEKYLNYSVTYSDGATIEQYDKLNSGETVTLKVRVEFKTDLNPEDLPGEGANVSLTYTSNYVQADGNAKDRNILGDNLSDEQLIAKVEEINSKIGTIVTGYSAKNLEWQVFYSDINETFLISKTLAKTNYSIPVKGINKDVDYEGSFDARNSSYATKWNSKWLAKCTADTENGGESTKINAQMTAFLCDPDNWNEYKTNSASYAVGGPTIELLVASWNKSQNSSIEISNNNIASIGYMYNEPIEFNNSPYVMTSEVKNGVYNPGANYWLASPGILIRHDEYVNYDGNGEDMRSVKDFGRVYGEPYYFHGQFWTEPNNGIRPIVSIPTSKISVNGDIVDVLP